MNTNNDNISLICFICGKNFVAPNFEQHVSQCQEPSGDNTEIMEIYGEICSKIKNGNNLSQDQVNEFNSKAQNLFAANTLHTCPKCGRRFLRDRLELHRKVC